MCIVGSVRCAHLDPCYAEQLEQFRGQRFAILFIRGFEAFDDDRHKKVEQHKCGYHDKGNEETPRDSFPGATTHCRVRNTC